VKIEKDIAEVDMAGTTYYASLIMTPEAKVGDYILLHTGYAIQVLDEKEALETLKIFEDLNVISLNS
jgi:hydrogenase expression/formation protein HypC